MRRREFIQLGWAAIAWPIAARAQRPSVPVIGFLNSGSADAYSDRITAFRDGLKELGYLDGQNVKVEYRWALGDYDRLPALATELAGRPVSVLVATGGEPAALAAKAAAGATVPIVFAIGSDPIKMGLVASHNRPSGNITGVNILAATLDAKRIGLLHELLPQALPIGVLLNPNFPAYQSQMQEIQEAASAADVQLRILRANTDEEIEVAFDSMSRERMAALAVAAAPFFDTRRIALVSFAEQHRIPTIYQFREFATAGGLMSYGVKISEIYRQVGNYAGRILKGEKPADLPVVQPTKFELVINLKTAKALGLTIPPTLLARADEVIE